MMNPASRVELMLSVAESVCQNWISKQSTSILLRQIMIRGQCEVLWKVLMQFLLLLPDSSGTPSALYLKM